MIRKEFVGSKPYKTGVVHELGVVGKRSNNLPVACAWRRRGVIHKHLLVVLEKSILVTYAGVKIIEKPHVAAQVSLINTIETGMKHSAADGFGNAKAATNGEFGILFIQLLRLQKKTGQY
jgi:hypothetical protein